MRKEGSSGTRRDFRVRYYTNCIVANNPYYHSVLVDQDVLSQLPDDAELHLPVVDMQHVDAN